MKKILFIASALLFAATPLKSSVQASQSKSNTPKKDRPYGLEQFKNYINKVTKGIMDANQALPETIKRNLRNQKNNPEFMMWEIENYTQLLRDDLQENTYEPSNILNYIQKKKKEYTQLLKEYGKSIAKTDPIYAGLDLLEKLQRDTKINAKEAFDILATNIPSQSLLFTVEDLLNLNPQTFVLDTRIRRNQTITTLDLSKKDLTGIKGLNNISEKLKKNVQVIDLSGNKITQITQQDNFMNFPKLRRIDLRKNPSLVTIAPEAFKNLPSLKAINLGKKTPEELKDNLREALKDRNVKVN